MERNSPYQMQIIWKIPCFSSADDLKSRSSSFKAKYALHRNIMYSIREIYLVFKSLKQNSPFQARMMASLRKICLVSKVMKQKRLISKVNHVKYTVFFDPWSETAFCTGMYSIYGICLFSPGHETRLYWIR